MSRKIFSLDYSDYSWPVSMSNKELMLIFMDFSLEFRNLFYFLSVLNQLQLDGFIEDYVEVPENTEEIFWRMFNSGEIHLCRGDLVRILDKRHDTRNFTSRPDWDEATKEKVIKFYFAFIDRYDTSNAGSTIRENTTT